MGLAPMLLAGNSIAAGQALRRTRRDSL